MIPWVIGRSAVGEVNSTIQSLNIFGWELGLGIGCGRGMEQV
jgi:hypothetical protein